MAKDTRGDFIREAPDPFGSPQVIDFRLQASGGLIQPSGVITPAAATGYGIAPHGRPLPFKRVAAFGGEEGGMEGGGAITRSRAAGASAKGISKVNAVPLGADIGAGTRKKPVAQTRQRSEQIASSAKAASRAYTRNYAVTDYDAAGMTYDVTFSRTLARPLAHSRNDALGSLGVGVGASARNMGLSRVEAEGGALSRAAARSEALAGARTGTLAMSLSGTASLTGIGSLAQSHPMPISKPKPEYLTRVRPETLVKVRTEPQAVTQPKFEPTAITRPAVEPTVPVKPTINPFPVPTPKINPVTKPKVQPRPEPSVKPSPKVEPRPEPVIPKIPGGVLPPFGFPSVPGRGGGEGVSGRGLAGFREHSGAWTVGEMAASIFSGKLGGKTERTATKHQQTVYGKEPGYFRAGGRNIKVIPLKDSKKGRNKGR